MILLALPSFLIITGVTGRHMCTMLSISTVDLNSGSHIVQKVFFTQEPKVFPSFFFLVITKGCQNFPKVYRQTHTYKKGKRVCIDFSLSFC